MIRRLLCLRCVCVEDANAFFFFSLSFFSFFLLLFFLLIPLFKTIFRLLLASGNKRDRLET